MRLQPDIAHRKGDNMKNHLRHPWQALAAALAALLLAAPALAIPTPLTMLSNAVSTDNPHSWLGGSSIIEGVEGDLVNGRYVGGGAAVTSAAGQSGLFNSFSAVAYANFHWIAEFSVAANSPVDIYLDWDMSMFSGTSFFGLIGYAVNETKATFGAYRKSGNSFVAIVPAMHVRYNDSATAGAISYLGSLAPTDSFYLIGDFNVGSAVQTISFGSALATDVGIFDFTLSAVEVPEPSTALLLGGGLVLLCLLHARGTRSLEA